MSEYKASEDDPYTPSDWLRSGDENDADFEFEQDNTLVNLRRNSSRLIKNNPIAFGIQQNIINSVLSGTINVQVTGAGAKKNKKYLDARTKDENLDLTLELMVSSAIERGDSLIHLPIVLGVTKVEIIESSRVRTPQKLMRDPNTRSGVQYKNNQLVGFWVRDLAPKTTGQGQVGYTFLPAYTTLKIDGETVVRQVARLFRPPLNRRPDQSRQPPILTPVMPLLRSISSYIESTIVGARLAASFSIIIRSKNPAGTKDSLEKTNGIKLNKIATMKPGNIALLSGNTESIESPSPNRPFDNTDQFLRRLLKLIAMALQTPFEMLFLDLSEVNFSSWKGGSLSLKRSIFRWHREIVTIREWVQMTWLTEAYAFGDISTHPNKVVLKTKMPKFEALDDEKTARADRLDVLQSKLKSKRTAIEDRNLDYDEESMEMQKEALVAIEEISEQLVLIKSLEEEHGITFSENSQRDEEGDHTGDRDTSSSRREGEEKDGDLSEEDKLERRQDDGNW